MHQTAHHHHRHDDGLTVGELVEEVVNLVAGLGIAHVPALVFALPGFVLLLPALLLTLPFAVAVAVCSLVRAARRPGVDADRRR